MLLLSLRSYPCNWAAWLVRLCVRHLNAGSTAPKGTQLLSLDGLCQRTTTTVYMPPSCMAAADRVYNDGIPVVVGWP